MTTTDLKPGDVVQHSEHGYGIFYVAAAGSLVMHRNAKGHVGIDDLDEEWERVETCTTEAVRILEDYQQIVSKSAGVVVRDAVVMMTTAAYESYRGREIVKPGHVQVRVDDLWAIRHRLDRWANVDEVDIDPHGNNLPEHNAESTLLIRVTKAIHAATKPAQPDEPTEFGARVTLDGHRWLRSGVAPRPFVNRHGARASWEELCATARRATLALTLGWDDES